MFLGHHVKPSETCKIKKVMISKSRDQCQKYSVNFIYALLALTKPLKIFPEVHHFVDNSGRLSDITPTRVKILKYKSFWFLTHVTSVQDTQEPFSTQFKYWLEPKRFFQKFFIFLIICGVPPASCQTQWNLQNKKDHNFMWPVQDILRNLYLCTFGIDETWKKSFR